MEVYDHGFSCYWRIENFQLATFHHSFTLKSQLFQVPTLKNSTWNLELRFHYFSNLKLRLTKDAGNEKEFFLKIWILTRNGWEMRSKKIFCHDLMPLNERGSLKLTPYPLKSSYLTNYIINGCLTFRCHMFECSSPGRVKPQQCVMTSQLIPGNRILHKSLLRFVSLKPNDLVNFSENVISRYCSPCRAKRIRTDYTETVDTGIVNVFNDSDNLLQQYKEKNFCYVTLQTASKNFEVHKALLCARSPVFNAMFELRMAENESNVVSIDDVDADTLSLLLQFLHLESVGDLDWEAAAKLYYAADKYQIELLKEESRNLLVRNISVQTICEGFIIADLHQDKELQEAAHDYLRENPKKVLLSPEWKELLFNRTTLAYEILCPFADGLIV